MIKDKFSDVIKLMCDALMEVTVTEFQTKYGYKLFRTIITPGISAWWKVLDKRNTPKISIEFCEDCECDSALIAQYLLLVRNSASTMAG